MTRPAHLGEHDLVLYEDLLAAGCANKQAARIVLSIAVTCGDQPAATFESRRRSAVVEHAMRLRGVAESLALPGPNGIPEWMERSIAALWRHAGESEPPGSYARTSHGDGTATLSARLSDGRRASVRASFPVETARRMRELAARGRELRQNEGEGDAAALDVIDQGLALVRTVERVTFGNCS